jgi:hypothetical protein
MDGEVYLKKQIKSMRWIQDAVIKSLVDEQLLEKPPGTVSPIGVIWLHMINGEDNFVSTITGEESLWKSDGWDERFGLVKAPNMGGDWSGFQETNLNVDTLRAYTEAVRDRTQTCLDNTTKDTLDETVKFYSDNDPKGNVWVLLVTHTLIHCGEIAALIGVQGGKGLPI